MAACAHFAIAIAPPFRGKRRGPLSPAQEVGRALHRIIQAVEQDERQEQQQVAEVGERADLS